MKDAKRIDKNHIFIKNDNIIREIIVQPPCQKLACDAAEMIY